MNAPQRVFKSGRVCIVLAGRMAGKKCLVLSSYDNGNRQRAFPHALVLGLSKVPKKITKRMNPTQVEERTNIKVFLKNINYSHLMPTRYVITSELDAKSLFESRTIASHEESRTARKEIAAILKKKFLSNTSGKSLKELTFLRKPLKF